MSTTTSSGSRRLPRQSRPPHREVPRPRGRPTRYQVLSVAKMPFLDELTAACATCDRAQSLSAGERNRQVEDGFFRASVALETFLSEWLVRCLSFDSSHLAQEAQREFDAWVRNGVNALEGRTARRYRAYLEHHSSALTIPRRPSLKEALSLFGSGGDVVGVRGAKDLEQKARANLIHTYAVRAMQLTARERAFLDATKKIRNALAHGSQEHARITDRLCVTRGRPRTISSSV